MHLADGFEIEFDLFKQMKTFINPTSVRCDVDKVN